MELLHKIISPDSAVYAVLILSLVIALGIAIGHISFLKIKLGVAGVLFSGLAFGHFHWSIDHHLLEFVREFGLILFVYTIGLQVGPGFLSSLKKNGLKLNMLAASVVVMGALLAVLFIQLKIVPPAAGIGVLSGSTTNTPSLGAGQEALKLKVDLPAEHLKFPSLAYAVAYPFGIMGLILTMILSKVFFRINTVNEAKEFEKNSDLVSQRISSLSLNVENPALNGKQIKDIPLVKDSGVVISRVMHDEKIVLAQPDTIIRLGDIVHVVGVKDKLKDVQTIVGGVSPINLRADVASDITTRRIIVTKHAIAGKTIKELSLMSMHEVNITRLQRSQVEFTATADITVQLGDELQAVGEEDSLNKLAQVVGDSPKELRHPYLVPIFIGIAVGLILGSIPIYFSGIPAPIKLGLAGGPLLAAIFFSNIYRIGPVVWFMPESANWMLREIGISLFLAAVGLKAGDQFVQTLVSGPGVLWLGLGTIITLVPPLIVACFARLFLKMNYLTLIGLLAGSMTDPPALAFANSQAKSSAISLAYASVYPLVMMLRVISVQLIVIFCS